MQTNSDFIKLKVFLSKARPQSRRRKGEVAQLNSLSICREYRSSILVSTPQETEK